MLVNVHTEVSCAIRMQPIRLRISRDAEAGGAVAVLHLDEVVYAGDGLGIASGNCDGGAATSAAAGITGATLHKTISFSGLTLHLEALSDAPDPAASFMADAGDAAAGEAAAADVAQTGDTAAPRVPASHSQANGDGWKMSVSMSSGDSNGGGSGGSQPASTSASSGSDSGSDSGISLPDSDESQPRHPSNSAIFCGDGGAGVSGRLDVRLTWPDPAAGAAGGGPRAAAQLSLRPLRAQLRQRHLPLLSDAALALSAALAGRAEPPVPPAGCASVIMQSAGLCNQMKP